MFKRQQPILNTSQMPDDPIEQIIWLDSVMEQVKRELDPLYEEAYFEARATGRFNIALQVGRASKKKALQWTRRRNEAAGRTIRWNDGY